jgi:hypothetical protein
MAFAALATVAVLIAAPAGAQTVSVARDEAPVVRIALTGKTDAQINSEIAAAATTVCGGSASGDCYYETLLDAKSQFYAFIHAHQPIAKLATAPASATLIRVSVSGKSPAQVDAEIREAAQKVCKATSNDPIDFGDCVTAATADATTQLQHLSQAAKPERLASN